MLQGRAQINIRLERAKLIMQPKKIDTHELCKYQVKFEAELWNRFKVLDAIQCNDLDATADTIIKVTYEAALLVPGRHQGKKPDKLLARMKIVQQKK